MVEQCEHNWKKIYYRKIIKGKKSQSWVTILDKFICDKCLKIKGLK